MNQNTFVDVKWHFAASGPSPILHLISIIGTGVPTWSPYLVQTLNNMSEDARTILSSVIGLGASFRVSTFSCSWWMPSQSQSTLFLKEVTDFAMKET